MTDSVTLAELPYTGFDYGEVYNSLFWVVLLVWSFIIARFIIKHSGTKLAKRVVNRQQQKLAVEKQALMREPEVLEERVIRYTDADMSFNQNTAQTVVPELDEQVVERVQDIVERELVVSREGQTPDEFSDEDFATTDFDGVNPDVYWQPKEEVQLVSESPYTPPRQQESPVVSVQDAAATQSSQMPPEPIKLGGTYKDSITLDKSEEYPKIVLTREDVAA